VGSDASSTAYIEQKKKFGTKIGAAVDHIKFAADASFDEIREKISSLNADKGIHGIIIQLPLPSHLDKLELIALISPDKDVDGLTKDSKFIPATARGILALLDFYKITVKGKKIAMLGRSMLVGAPTARLLTSHGAHVTICHSQTANEEEITKASDIIIVAIGKAELIDEKYIGTNHPVIVDVGINSLAGRLVGDVSFKKIEALVSAISPVPGGVGPMTVLSLFENLVLTAGIK
jgi:methylenetetrahydrofolate dehydrogenase (NADP+)/methenyltetrahydrofolate cyclohydrolase